MAEDRSLGGPLALSWHSDELGQAAVLRIDTAVYSRAAIFKTAYWYTNRAYLYLSPTEVSGVIAVEVRPKTQITTAELEVICREFCNALVDQEARQVVIGETQTVRELLLRKAFFEGQNRAAVPVASNESQIPSREDSYSEDPKGVGKITGA